VANLTWGYQHSGKNSGDDERSRDRSSDAPITQDEAAKLLNVGVASVRRARRLRREDPELAKRVEGRPC
jgi:hypothetical protein